MAVSYLAGLMAYLFHFAIYIFSSQDIICCTDNNNGTMKQVLLTLDTATDRHCNQLSAALFWNWAIVVMVIN
jgi:hypothetical protein